MERWERELDRLRGLTLSAGARARVDRGPEGDGMPPSPDRGQRVMAGFVAFAVFGAALALAAGAFNGGDDTPPATAAEPAVITLVAGDNAPEMTLTYQGREAGSSHDSRCWAQANNAQQCADVVPHEPFADADFLAVPGGTPFTLENRDGADPVRFRIEAGALPKDDGSARSVSLDDLEGLDPGRYVLTVQASWAGRGDNITFHFALEITASSAVPAPDELRATLDAPDDGGLPNVTLSYGDQEMTLTACGGQWNGDQIACDMMLHVFDARIEPGAVIRVSGDFSEITGSTGLMDSLGGPSAPLDLTSGAASLPDEAGTYLLSLNGHWPAGDAGISVQITIGHPTPPPPPSGALAGTSWELTEIDGEPIDTGGVPQPATMFIGKDRLGGSTGCNAYGANWSLEGGALHLGPIQMTLVRCVSTTGDVEQRFLAVLGGDPRITIGEFTLELSTDAGIATFARIDVGDTDVAGSFLDCIAEDHVAITHEDMYADPGPPTYFTVNMTGLQDGDEFERIRGSADLAESSRWIVVRDGMVVAEVNYPKLDGVACLGSGVGGA